MDIILNEIYLKYVNMFNTLIIQTRFTLLQNIFHITYEQQNRDTITMCQKSFFVEITKHFSGALR